MNIKKLKDIESGVWLSIATCFMLFLYAPMELLFTNQDEFWFDLYILVPIMLVVFVITVSVSIMLFYIFRARGGGRILEVYFIVFFCSYIQGNWLTGGLPILDGRRIEWQNSAERTKSIILWVIVTIVVAALYKLRKKYFGKIVKVVSICMILMFCITILILAIENRGFEKKSSLVMTQNDMFEMSSDGNFIILVLDAVDAMRLQTLIDSDEEYSEIFKDFTFYNNMVGAYPFTKHSIPYILTGQWFENETEFRDYEVEAYRSSPLLAMLEDKNYTMSVYTAELLLEDNVDKRFNNIMTNQRGISDKWAFIRWQIKMTGFKYAPWDFKKIFYINFNAFNKLKIPPEGERLFTASNGDFYRNVLEEEFQYSKQKCFKFIHIDGAHEPYTYDKNVNETVNATYETSLQASMTITKAYLDKLKEGGVYDNSVIIVMADHGYNDGMHDKTGEMRQNPIFFVKGINESHAFRVSQAPVSFEDLQMAYQRLLNGMGSDEIFDWKKGDRRNRRFLVYQFRKEDSITEYIQPSEAWDTEQMYKTGNVYDRN